MNATLQYTVHPALDGSMLAPFHPFIRERIERHARHACEYAIWLDHSLLISCPPPTNPAPLRAFLWPLAESIAAVLLVQQIGSEALNCLLSIAPFPPEGIPAAEEEYHELDARLAAEFELGLFNEQISRAGRAIIVHESP